MTHADHQRDPNQPSAFATRTTTRLLDALRDQSNEPIWTQFDARFRPVIRGLATRLGVGGSDAEEVAQQTLAEFVKAYREGRYDRSRGRLSSWILGIAHHTALRVIRDRHRSRGHASLDAVEKADESTLRSHWNDERDRVILHEALAALHEGTEIDERTLNAFELTALRGVPAAAAAEQCGMSVDQVYVARSRVTRRLRTLVKEMTDAFEEDV